MRSRKTKILTTVILVVFRGLKFESDADIGGKDSFRSGTIYRVLMQSGHKLELMNKLGFRRNIKLYGSNTDYK